MSAAAADDVARLLLLLVVAAGSCGCWWPLLGGLVVGLLGGERERLAASDWKASCNAMAESFHLGVFFFGLPWVQACTA
jgi:hypothetical protein